jgi:hypothetical protein
MYFDLILRICLLPWWAQFFFSITACSLQHTSDRSDHVGRKMVSICTHLQP